jgi:hypothetical protein
LRRKRVPPTTTSARAYISARRRIAALIELIASIQYR